MRTPNQARPGRPRPRRRGIAYFQRTTPWTRAPAMELGDRSRLSDQCDAHSRTGLGQTKRTGRPRRRQEAPTPNVSLSTSSKSFPLPWSTP